MDAADAHLCRLEHCQTAWDAIAALGLLQVARPTMSQKETARRWLYDWKLSIDVVETALRYSVEKGIKSPLP